MNEWTDDSFGYGLLDQPYVAVNHNQVYLHINGTLWHKDCYWGPPAIDIARQAGLPVFVAQRDWRRTKSIMWIRDHDSSLL